MSVIESVYAREVLDSRGNPTVEVEVVLESEETRESQPGRDAEFRGPLLPGIGRLHKLIAGRERNVERLGTPENITVLVADGGFQSVEARRGASFQIDLETLFQGRGTAVSYTHLDVYKRQSPRGRSALRSTRRPTRTPIWSSAPAANAG